MNGLRVSFEGCDNNQTLTVFYGSVIAFQGFADDLVTSVNNELQIRLNFSGGRGFLHTLRRSGGFVLLLPEIPEGDVEPIHYPTDSAGLRRPAACAQSHTG